jgi:uncharacterized protein YdaU (DUF1376 family)
MPLYIGDYLADTMHLSHSQHGIYMLLIMAYWRNGGALPDDANQLSAIAKCSASEWRKHLPVISRFFHIENGSWFHKRIDAELTGAITKTQERSKSGSEGARRRWQTDSKPIAEPLANASQNDAPSPSQRKKEDPPTPRGGRVSASEEFEGWWQECPRKVGKDAAVRKYLIARRSTDAETLLAGIQRYRASVADKDPQYVVHPAAWLHQGRWKDELPNGSPSDAHDRPTGPAPSPEELWPELRVAE